MQIIHTLRFYRSWRTSRISIISSDYNLLRLILPLSIYTRIISAIINGSSAPFNVTTLRYFSRPCVSPRTVRANLRGDGGVARRSATAIQPDIRWIHRERRIAGVFIHRGGFSEAARVVTMFAFNGIRRSGVSVIPHRAPWPHPVNTQMPSSPSSGE